jgi:hypothetical protein
MSKRLIFGVMMAILGCWGQAAWATPTVIGIHSLSGLEGVGAYTGYLTYNCTGETATVTVDLQNTSLYGYLTAFAFNNPANLITGVELTASSFFHFVLGKPDFEAEVNAPPIGTFDIGASTSSKWLGGGNPDTGIPAKGGLGTFTFTLTGTHLDDLTALSFGEALNSMGYVFAARFRGDGISDKVVAGVDPPVPLPSTVVLLGSGLLGLAGWRRFRKG